MSSAENTKKGKIGEQLAVNFLTQKGFHICCQNYRFGRAEIDIIAQQGNLLVFVEVKLRKSTFFGLPEESVSPKKIGLIQLAADQYTYDLNWDKPIRFDVVSILQQGTKTEFVHLEDAF